MIRKKFNNQKKMLILKQYLNTYSKTVMPS